MIRMLMSEEKVLTIIITVNWEIFVIKIFSWVGSTTKIKHENFLTTKICKHVYGVVCCKFMLKSLAAAETLSAWSYCLASDSE